MSRKVSSSRSNTARLLRLAIILFCFDVGIRRIQLDREEWLRVTQTLRRWFFFWQPPPRPVEAEESLAALLARRDAVLRRHARFTLGFTLLRTNVCLIRECTELAHQVTKEGWL